MKHTVPDELPYERFMQKGPESLTNAELLAVILRTGSRNTPAVELGRKILAVKDPQNTLLSVLWSLSLEEMLSIKGIGEVKAVKLLCLKEIARRMAEEHASERMSFGNAADAAGLFMERLRHETKEYAYLLLLDNRLGLIAEELLSIGSVNAAILDPREIFIHALDRKAVHILLLHNHPSGDPTPSGEDIEITGRILRAGELLGIRLIDHIIIGDGTYASLREMDLMRESR